MVMNVDYHHTPEHVFPTAWEDVEDAIIWIHKNLDDVAGDGQQFVIGGISAGGNLAASMTLQQHLGQGPLARLPKIRGQVLMIPCLVHMDYYEKQRMQLSAPEVSSLLTMKDAPVLPVERMRLFMDLLKLPEGIEEDDKRLNVGNASAEEVRGLPPTVLGIAGMDPLRDEGLFYAKLLADNGQVRQAGQALDAAADDFQGSHTYHCIQRCASWLQTIWGQVIS